MLDGKRILFVEDDETYAGAVTLVFETYAPEAFILVVGTLAEARAHLARHAYDVILLDLRLPDAQHDLVALLTLLCACPDTPIVVLTAYSNWREEALEAGAKRFLVKAEVDNDTLITTLAEIVDPTQS